MHSFHSRTESTSSSILTVDTTSHTQNNNANTRYDNATLSIIKIYFFFFVFCFAISSHIYTHTMKVREGEKKRVIVKINNAGVFFDILGLSLQEVRIT